MRLSALKGSRKKNMPQKKARVGLMYCVKPRTFRGSSLAPYEKSSKGTAVTMPAPSNKRAVVTSPNGK